jgi:WD40 repeat protein
VREICVVKPYRGAPLPTDSVLRLRFDAAGESLLAWLGRETRLAGARVFYAPRVVVHDVARGKRIPLGYDDLDENGMEILTCEVSPDRRLVVFEYDWHEPGNGLAGIVDLTKPDEGPWTLPTGTAPTGAFAFTEDGVTLLAARNNLVAPDFFANLVRFETDAVTRPATRFQTQRNILTGQLRRIAVRNVKWKEITPLPRDSGGACSLAASADLRMAAVGTHHGWLVVIDLRKKALVLQNEWRGRRLRDRWALRVGFDPTGEWVAMIANGRLFADRIKAGGWEWQTKSTLGYLSDFAYHPSGEFVAAVDAAGVARFLDPRTGKVKREFRWKRGPLYSVAFSPDGLMCAAGGEGGRVVLWDVDT